MALFLHETLEHLEHGAAVLTQLGGRAGERVLIFYLFGSGL